MIFIGEFNGDVSHTRRYAERGSGVRVRRVTSNRQTLVAAPERSLKSTKTGECSRLKRVSHAFPRLDRGPFASPTECHGVDVTL